MGSISRLFSGHLDLAKHRTDRVDHRIGRRATSAATAAAAILAAPHALSAQSPADDLPFASHFEGVIEPLAPELRDIDPLSPSTAVDLDTFDAPLEPKPEPAGVIRNLGTGVASYYGRRFHGRLTANGERFDMRAMTAAHKTLPFGTMVRVTNPRNGRSVTVRINDRGPFIAGRTIDLSRGAAERIGMISSGHARVQLELVGR
ncbi:MAG: septal ring lytic transglycosylase RlpA family protein [Erythrobacter sp.]